MRVLIADDDATYRQFLGDLLTDWNFDVTIAKDGPEALAVMAGENPPPMAILDWQMPGMDGFEVTRILRADHHDRTPYLLIITGARRKEELMQILVCGADNFLMKPFDPLDLKIQMRTAMRIVHLQEDLAARETPCTS